MVATKAQASSKMKAAPAKKMPPSAANEQWKELLYQALETEMGGIEVYENAVTG